jgi:hypothetical protein
MYLDTSAEKQIIIYSNKQFYLIAVVNYIQTMVYYINSNKINILD